MTEMKNNPHIDIDPVNKTLYVRFTEGKCFETVEVGRGILIDLSSKQELVGIEFLDFNVPRKLLHLLAKKYHNPYLKRIHPEKAAMVFA